MFKEPSLHSKTTGLQVPVEIPISGFSSKLFWTTASAILPAFSVVVKAILVSIVPNSSIWTNPILLPNPLNTYDAPTTFSLKMFPEWGLTTVTPVLNSGVSLTVKWETQTSLTSQILFFLPVSPSPILINLLIFIFFLSKK